MNLLPVYPLDGGHVSRELCTLAGARRGIVLSLWISMVTSGLIAAYAALQWGSLYLPLLFGYLALMNYQTLKAYQQNSW
jgi:membrane-associated protease RseP (regulator of RpoE activity)